MLSSMHAAAQTEETRPAIRPRASRKNGKAINLVPCQNRSVWESLGSGPWAPAADSTPAPGNRSTPIVVVYHLGSMRAKQAANRFCSAIQTQLRGGMVVAWMKVDRMFEYFAQWRPQCCFPGNVCRLQTIVGGSSWFAGDLTAMATDWLVFPKCVTYKFPLLRRTKIS